MNEATNIISTFKEKRREKQLKYERKMLKELSLEILRKRAQEHFAIFAERGHVLSSSLEDGCLDHAIEAYLLGAKYSRFGYYGENTNQVQLRLNKEEKYLIDSLYDYMLYWGADRDGAMYQESMYLACESYIQTWWKEGFTRGTKRYLMRLH